MSRRKDERSSSEVAARILGTNTDERVVIPALMSIAFFMNVLLDILLMGLTLVDVLQTIENRSCYLGYL